jgi:hypothetical protein
VALYTYVVARDFGFAPNPFFGFCTLATCKSAIRGHARSGDWVVGTGAKKIGRQGQLVYAMQVSERLAFDDYWADPRFRDKRPTLTSGWKRAFGDNIYRRDPQSAQWLMLPSHHSHHDGQPNAEIIETDTRRPYVLIGSRFSYFGGDGPHVPERFRDFAGEDVVCRFQGHRSRFSPELERAFVEWLESLGIGRLGEPVEWLRGRALRRKR